MKKIDARKLSPREFTEKWKIVIRFRDISIGNLYCGGLSKKMRRYGSGLKKSISRLKNKQEPIIPISGGLMKQAVYCCLPTLKDISCWQQE